MIRDDQPDAREGQAGRGGVAERPVVPLKPGNAGGGKGPQFKTNATSGEGPGIGKPINSETCSKAADGVARESEGGSWLSLLRAVRQSMDASRRKVILLESAVRDARIYPAFCWSDRAPGLDGSPLPLTSNKHHRPLRPCHRSGFEAAVRADEPSVFTSHSVAVFECRTECSSTPQAIA